MYTFQKLIRSLSSYENRVSQSYVNLRHMQDNAIMLHRLTTPWSHQCWKALLAGRGCSLLVADSFSQKLGNMGTPSLPSEIFCSLHTLIWRMSLGLEDRPYLKTVSQPEASLIFILILCTDSC